MLHVANSMQESYAVGGQLAQYGSEPFIICIVGGELGHYISEPSLFV